MDAQTKFTHLLLKLVNAKKMASKSVLKPTRAKQFSFPKRLKKYQIDHFLVQNRAVLTFSSNANEAKNHIVFLHGGAYTAEENNAHWWMVEQIVKQSACKLSFIQYPLAPEHNYKHAHAMLTEAYSEITIKNPNDRFYLLGDSAGGGFALAFTQILRDNNFPARPEKTALLSPWLDLSMSNPGIKELEPKDLILSTEALKKCAGWFAGGTHLKSPVLSPLYGDMNGLQSVAIFVGTHEILLPDCRLLKQKTENSDTTLFYKEYEGMQHDWLLFPIKERNILLSELLHYFSD